VVSFAPAPLETLLCKALKKGKYFDELSLRKRHRLRVALKKLRYAIEFFQPLFRDGNAKRYRKKLALLQKLLGKDSDTITTTALLQELTKGDTSSSLRHAAASLKKWQSEQRRAAAARSRKAWVKFKDMQPFW
jgi:triphosphatase